MTDISVRDIEIALTLGGPLDKGRYIVVPNVHWGWGLSYEADLIAVRHDTHVVTEVEIKRTMQDFRNDGAKQKFRNGMDGLDSRVRRFFYAVPHELGDRVEAELPIGAGLYVIGDGADVPGCVEIRRKARPRVEARPATPDEILKLHQLAAMRYWNMVKTMNRYHKNCNLEKAP